MSNFQHHTAEELAKRNGAALLATQLQTLEREHIEAARRHHAEMTAMIQRLTEAQRIGVKVQQLAAAGRKTVRLADLIEEKP